MSESPSQTGARAGEKWKENPDKRILSTHPLLRGTVGKQHRTNKYHVHQIGLRSGGSGGHRSYRDFVPVEVQWALWKFSLKKEFLDFY